MKKELKEIKFESSLKDSFGNGIAGNGISGNGMSGNGISGNGLSDVDLGIIFDDIITIHIK